MSVLGSPWEKVQIKKIPSIPGTPDAPGGKRPPRTLKPAVFDPTSKDADSDGWRQEGTTARWYGLIPSNPLYKNILKNLENIKDPETTTNWLPPGNSSLDEWLGNINQTENARLKAPDFRISTLEADLSFVAGSLDLRIRQSQASSRPAPNVASESRRAAAWVKGREIQRQREGQSQQVFSGAPEDTDAKVDELIEAAKKKRVENDAKIKTISELDKNSADKARRFDPSSYNTEKPEMDDWVSDWEEGNPKPNRGDFDTAEDWAVALEDWDIQSELEYESFLMDADQDDQMFDDLGEIFNFEFETENGDKYEFVLSYIDDASTVSVALNFDIRTVGDNSRGDPEGTSIGNVKRTLSFYDAQAYHDIFELSDEFRGDKISTIVNARNEQIYEKMGITSISAFAVSSRTMNGATHWPKVGFDWASADDRDIFVNTVQNALNFFASKIQDDPNTLPTIKTTRNNVDYRIPVFSSREEAEIIANLLERVRNESFDDPSRLTAADLVNWSGAESYFKLGAVRVNLMKPVGGDPEKQNSDGKRISIPDAEMSEIFDEMPEPVPPLSGQDAFLKELQETTSQFTPRQLQEDSGIGFAKFLESLEKSWRWSDWYAPENNIPRVPIDKIESAGLLPPPVIEFSTMQEDIEAAFEFAKSYLFWFPANADLTDNRSTLDQLNFEEAVKFVQGRQAKRAKTLAIKNSKPDGLKDYRDSDVSLDVDFDKAVGTSLDPTATPEEIAEDLKRMTDLEKKTVAHLTRVGAEWRHVSYTDIDGSVRNIARDYNEDGSVKSAIAHNLGELISKELSVELMWEFALSELMQLDDREVETELVKLGLMRSGSYDGFLSPRNALIITPDGIVEILRGNAPIGERVSDFNNYSTYSRGTIISPEDPQYEKYLGEYIASNLVSSWANSSTDGFAVGIQEAARRLFGQSDVLDIEGGFAHHTPRSMEPGADVDGKAKLSEVYDTFVKVQYETTQRSFREAGITEVVLHRGMIWREGSNPSVFEASKESLITIKDAEVALNPLSSTAYDRETAYKFAEVSRGNSASVMVQSRVPVERILSTALTGLGAKFEHEMILLGGGDTRFELKSSVGTPVEYTVGEIETTFDTFRRGQSLERTLTERLQGAGYDDEEIKKIQAYMDREYLEKIPSKEAIDDLLKNSPQ